MARRIDAIHKPVNWPSWARSGRVRRIRTISSIVVSIIPIVAWRWSRVRWRWGRATTAAVIIVSPRITIFAITAVTVIVVTAVAVTMVASVTISTVATVTTSRRWRWWGNASARRQWSISVASPVTRVRTGASVVLWWRWGRGRHRREIVAEVHGWKGTLGEGICKELVLLPRSRSHRPPGFETMNHTNWNSSPSACDPNVLYKLFLGGITFL